MVVVVVERHIEYDPLEGDCLLPQLVAAELGRP